MRLTLFILAFFISIPDLLYSQSDTISIFDLKPERYGAPKSAMTYYGPTNILYAIQEKYYLAKKLYSGKAKGYNGEYYELVNGKITLFYQDNGYERYHFHLVEKDSVIAIDTSIRRDWKKIDNNNPFTGVVFLQTQIIYRKNNEWRMRQQVFDSTRTLTQENNYIIPGCINRYIQECGCDSKSYVGVNDGLYFYSEGKINYYYIYKNGDRTAEKDFFTDGKLFLQDSTDEFGAQQGYNYEANYRNEIPISEGYHNHGEQAGHWIYYDTLGHVLLEEWFTNNPLFEHVLGYSSILDSSRTYYPDGKIEETYLGEFHNGNQIIHDAALLNKSSEYSGIIQDYYRNGQLQKVQSDFLAGDTSVAEFYPDGKIKYYKPLDKLNQPSRYWYPTGKLQKETNEQWPDRKGEYISYRDGRYKEWDTSGVLLIDREYDNGIFLKAYDSNYNKNNLVRDSIKQLLYRPAWYIAQQTDLNGNVPWFNPKTYWRKSYQIPVTYIDSIQEILTTVYLSLPDSLKFLRKLMTDSAKTTGLTFANGKPQFTYTIVSRTSDSLKWMDNCGKGKIIVTDRNVDSIFAHVSYRVSSYSFSKNSGTVTVIVDQPLNTKIYSYAASSGNSYDFRNASTKIYEPDAGNHKQELNYIIWFVEKYPVADVEISADYTWSNENYLSNSGAKYYCFTVYEDHSAEFTSQQWRPAYHYIAPSTAKQKKNRSHYRQHFVWRKRKYYQIDY
ncbi:MAG: hypothetical protein HY064_00685 [Bacteroidetes bacterium]|nr:hypothetical protein [Bacteroidota bacterium]